MLLAGDGLDEDLATEPSKTWRGAALIAQSSPPGKEGREREREREREG